MSSVRLLWLSAVVLLLGVAPARAADDPERKAPTAEVKPLTVHQWTSKNELRFTWVVPEGYDGKTPRNLTVILHGTGLDYRWGHWNNKPGVFRPADIVVSVDGPSPGQGETRLFLGEPKDAAAIKAFLAELRASFAVDRIFLYGHSQGGFFVVYYAGEFPETVAGVVAHASGAWNWSKMPPALKKVPIAFVHGSSDPVVPYGQSPGSRDAYVEKGFELVSLRRMAFYNHWPNAIRNTEALDWCQGMGTSSPEEALACALRLLTKKPADEYQWVTTVAFSQARDVLRRLEGKGPAPFKDVPAGVASEAKKWITAIEAQGKEHVEALKKTIGKKGLVLDDKLQLGHLMPLREDFRGVECVEAFFKELGWDKKVEAQDKAGADMWKAYWQEKDEPAVAKLVIESLPKAFVFEQPDGFRARAEKWRTDKLPLGGKLGYEALELWTKSWDEGSKAYESLWKKWDGPKPEKR